MYHHAGESEPVTFIGLDDLQSMQADLTTAELLTTINLAWRDIRAAKSFGGKAVLSLPEEEFWSRPEFQPFKADFTEQRLGWKLSSLYSVNAHFGAVKIIGANAFNRRLGLPRSTSTIVLLEKMTMRPIAILDGTAISATRTGTYASKVFQRCFPEQEMVSVFVFGAGPVARAAISCLAHIASNKIRQIFVRSRTFDGAESMTALLRAQTTIPLIAVEDNSRLCDCAFVVTASNARQPVFEDGELLVDAVTLHLGGDEVPQAYLVRALRTGTVVCDSLAMVSHRRSQSLALHFWRNGLSLETVGSLLGIRELSASQDWYLKQAGPVCITCVGLPMLDLYVAQATFEKYVKAHDRISSPN
jgi:ornithine cyclodeaminase/alanine dehydrogenase-like protein (mu-crystallin family)